MYVVVLVEEAQIAPVLREHIEEILFPLLCLWSDTGLIFITYQLVQLVQCLTVLTLYMTWQYKGARVTVWRVIWFSG